LNIVEVNYHDLLGRIFGGYDLHLSLNKIDGVSAVQYVALKGSDTPTVQAFCDDPVILEERRYLEHRFSISQLLSPYGLQLLEEPAFQEADVVHFNILHNDTLSLLDLPRLMERDNVVVASKWANVVAGAGSVKSSAGTYTACTEVIEPLLVDVIRS